MKEIPPDAVAVRLKNGNVYHPIWPRESKPGWFTGTCVLGTHVGGTSMFEPKMVGNAFSQNAYEVLRLTWTAAEQEKARLAGLAAAEPEDPAEPGPVPLPAPAVGDEPKPRQFPVSIHMVVKATSQEEADRIVRSKMSRHLNGWFCEDTDAAEPSPVGSLLWYRYDSIKTEGPAEE